MPGTNGRCGPCQAADIAACIARRSAGPAYGRDGTDEDTARGYLASGGKLEPPTVDSLGSDTEARPLPTIRANGIDIAYDTHGAGPPLVLLHGATSVGSRDFAAQIPLFGRAFQLIVPDARGHGRTRWDAANGFRYDWLVDDLAAFVDELGLATFHLLGFSMGAMTALQYGTRHPERLRTLTIVGITTQREPRLAVLRGLTDPARVDREDPAWGRELARRHDPGQGEGAWRRLLPAITADVAVQPLLSPGELHRVDPPALVAVGDRDPFVPVDHAWGISRQLGDGRLLVVPGCGHEVMSRRAGLFNEALAGFFRATEAVARERADARPHHPHPRVGRTEDHPFAAPAGDPVPDRDWIGGGSRGAEPAEPAEPEPPSPPGPTTSL